MGDIDWCTTTECHILLKIHLSPKLYGDFYLMLFDGNIYLENSNLRVTFSKNSRCSPSAMAGVEEFWWNCEGRQFVVLASSAKNSFITWQTMRVEPPRKHNDFWISAFTGNLRALPLVPTCAISTKPCSCNSKGEAS